MRTENSDKLRIEDHFVFESAPSSRRPKACMSILLSFSLLVVLVAGTLLILDTAIPPCTSFLRSCETNGTRWFAPNKNLTREERINICDKRGYKTASISIAKDIFAVNSEFFNASGNFWIIDEEFERPKTFHNNMSTIITTPRPVKTLNLSN
jgi:hypothetical protein